MMTLSSRSIRLVGTFALALAAACGAGLAQASGMEAASDVPKITVSYKDLDLSRPADVRVLYARLRHAADSVCQPYVRMGDPLHHAPYDQCYGAALARAVEQVNAPQLLALHKAEASRAMRRG